MSFMARSRTEVNDRGAELFRNPLGDQRPVAGLGIALDAQERGRTGIREPGDERREVDLAEDLAQIALAVLGRELDARALPDAQPVVLPVLELPKLGRRRELFPVVVRDPRLREGRLEPLRVRPRVLAPAHAAPLADVEDEADIRLAQRLEEALERPPVDADRGDLRIQNAPSLAISPG
jgi:hypothetical protein